MARPEPILDIEKLDTSIILADKEAIQAVLPQRFEMQQLDAVVYEDVDNLIVAGFKDVKISEFWVRGHMPDYPLLPGVLMCEAAAQLCSYLIVRKNAVKSNLVGLGGIENARFRKPVYPGDRLILVGKAVKMHPRKMTIAVQGYVDTTLVFHADIIGIALQRKEDDES